MIDILPLFVNVVDPVDDNAGTQSLRAGFRSIRQQAVAINEAMVRVDQGLIQASDGSKPALRSQYLEIYRSYLSQAKDLLALFNSSMSQLDPSEIQVSTISDSVPVRSYLREIMVGCDRVLGYLKPAGLALSHADQERLDICRSDAMEICSGLDRHFARNVEMASDAIEGGHFLGGAMILCKLSGFALSSIPGDTAQEKAGKVPEESALKVKGDDLVRSMERSEKAAGEYLSLNMEVFPDFSSVMGIFEDCTNVLRALRASGESPQD